MTQDIIASAVAIKAERQFIENNKDDTIYTLADNSEITFDNVYARWMRRLYLLLSYIAEERDKRGISIETMSSMHRYQFFGLAESAVDQLMYFFSKDLLSCCEYNKYLDQLSYHILYGSNVDSTLQLETNTPFDELYFVQFKRYLVRLICEEFNSFTVANFYDFYINFWSGFECCINLICSDYEEAVLKKLNDSNVKKMKKFLKSISPSDGYEYLEREFDNHTEKFLKQFGVYVSFPDKCDYLLKDVLGKAYRRDIKEDLKILDFGGAMRNTMHNNGTHLKADKEIEIDGKRFVLRKDEKRYSDDFTDIFTFAKEIFDIYLEIVDCLNDVKQP